jgi:signal transduction histidine kinase
MNIQAKLASVYIVLLSFGVIVISAYAILSIRSFLLDEAIENFEEDAQTFAASIPEDATNDDLYDQAMFVSELTGFNVALFDTMGNLIVVSSVNDQIQHQTRDFLGKEVRDQLDRTNHQVIRNDSDSELLISFHKIRHNSSDARYLRISQLKADLYAVSRSIRHLIYGAMVGSILVVITVSFFFAQYLARPIKQLKEAALDIAGGNLDREINVNRDDEFGSLAESLNQMAGNLKADNEQLKNLNEKQNQFFADITHEVRNPLHTISGSLEMIQIPNLDQEKKDQYMATAQKQIQRVVRLFEDIKSLQRYDYDESFINKSTFNVCGVVREVVDTYIPMAAKKNISMQLVKAEESTVEADRDKIEQVVDNLVSNALKYTASGEIDIWCVHTKDGLVEISVEDTGIGIAKEHLERLFDRFYRTDKARSRDKGGTGLGLAVVKGILAAHDREIKVESIPGKGSKFYFTLELKNDA